MTRLTAQDVRALHNADTLCFYHIAAEGQSRIRAIKRDGGDGFEQTRTILTECSIRDYGNGWMGGESVYPPSSAHNIAGYHHEGSAKFSETVPSIMRRIRAGDTLTLLWTLDNNNNLTREAGLHVDMLHIRITHATVGAPETYLVQQAISRDNSARMIRRTGGAR